MSEQWCFFSVSRRDNFPNHDDHVLLRPQQTSTPIRSKLDHVQYMASDTWCSLFKKKKCFWLCWVFVALGGFSLVAVCRLLVVVASLVVERSLQGT